MKRILMLAVMAAASLGLTSCGLLMFGTVVTAAAVTGTGYAVYKTGEAVVDTTGKAAAGVYNAGATVAVSTGKAVGQAAVATGKAAGSAGTGVQEIIFFNNELKSTVPADVRSTYLMASNSLHRLGFSNVDGRTDAASGRLEAMTVENEKIEIALQYKEPLRTTIRIRVGVRGNSKTAELIYDHIVAGL